VGPRPLPADRGGAPRRSVREGRGEGGEPTGEPQLASPDQPTSRTLDAVIAYGFRSRRASVTLRPQGAAGGALSRRSSAASAGIRCKSRIPGRKHPRRVYLVRSRRCRSRAADEGSLQKRKGGLRAARRAGFLTTRLAIGNHALCLGVRSPRSAWRPSWPSGNASRLPSSTSSFCPGACLPTWGRAVEYIPRARMAHGITAGILRRSRCDSPSCDGEGRVHGLPPYYGLAADVGRLIRRSPHGLSARARWCDQLWSRTSGSRKDFRPARSREGRRRYGPVYAQDRPAR